MKSLSIIANYLSNHLESSIAIFLVLFAIWRIRRQNQSQREAKEILDELIASNQNEPLTLHPEIDSARCTGCAACTTVCPEGDILKLVNHKAVLISPTKCIGHGECERACPMGAISLVFGTKTKGMDIPRLTRNYETNVSGVYIAGELGGMGLIRNAVKQGVAAATHALRSSQRRSGTEYDLVIIGAGPAGIAAALVAVAQKKKYLVIEQNSFGGTVYNYPRQKLVMTHPAQLPIFGKMKFPNNKVTKEQLLSFWSSIRSKANLQILEKTKFEGMARNGDSFSVHTNRGDITASKVILAMGLRGTPRKLGLANEDLPKVTYSLLEPEQYQNAQICIVGAGNAAVEAAQMLANPKLGNVVTLLVRGTGFDRCKEENKEIILKMEKQGYIEILYETTVATIEEKHLTLSTKSEQRQIENDFLFVFAGADIPHKFLMSLGIKMDKKFGEGFDQSA